MTNIFRDIWQHKDTGHIVELPFGSRSPGPRYTIVTTTNAGIKPMDAPIERSSMSDHPDRPEWAIKMLATFESKKEHPIAELLAFVRDTTLREAAQKCFDCAIRLDQQADYARFVGNDDLKALRRAANETGDLGHDILKLIGTAPSAVSESKEMT